MLGNVPDFVILALALSKLDAAVVPIDPTTGGRELELILAAAPLRALVTRPRGSEGGQARRRPRPTTRAPPTRRARPRAPPSKFVARDPPPPAGHAAHLQRLQARAAADLSTGRRARGRAVHRRLGGDPKGVLRDRREPGRGRRTRSARRSADAEDRVLVPCRCTTATAGTSASCRARARRDDVPRGGDLADRIGKLLREHDIDFLPGTPALYGELSRCRPPSRSRPRTRASCARGSTLPAEHRRELPRAVRHPPAVLLPLDRGRAVAHRRRRQGPRDRSASRSRASRCASPAPKGDTADGGRDGADLGRASRRCRPLGRRRKMRPAQARRRRRDRRARQATAGSAPATSASSTRAGRLDLTGREDDVVKVDGKRVALGEVEGCLEAFPKVKAAQAPRRSPTTRRRDGRRARGRAPSKCRAEEIIDHCARNLAPYKVPRRIEFCES